jgi:RNase P/RNase MRP subunit POP5
MPVSRARRRYLAFKVHSEKRVDQPEMWNIISTEVRYLYGVKGSAEADPRLIEYDPSTCFGVLRCSHNYLREVRAALAHVTEIGGDIASIQVLRVSGTIKTLRDKIRQDSAYLPP